MKKYYILISILLILFSFESNSATTKSTVMSISVTIAEELCSFNANQDISVDFGIMDPESINGSTYVKNINHQVFCPESFSHPLHLKFIGLQSGSDINLLETSKDGLAIKILLNNTQIELNKIYPFQVSDNIKAAPFKKLENIESGEFSASVVMELSYE